MFYSKVSDWIDNNSDGLIKLLTGLISKASVNPVFSHDEDIICEENVQKYIQTYIEQLGFTTELWEPNSQLLSKYEGKAGYYAGRDFKKRPNLYGKMEGSGNGKSILLTGHSDVVKAGTGWTVNPFGKVVKDGFIYGRGAIDMKGGIAAMIYAVEAILKSGLALKGDVQIGTVCDEENGGMGTLAFVDRGYRADACILTEPTDLDVQPMCRGILWGEILVRGKSGHIEMDKDDWKNGGAVDAIQIARTIMDAIEHKNREWEIEKTHPLIDLPCQIKISQIQAGDYPTTYADACKIYINVQYLPSDKDENGVGNKIKREVEEVINNATIDNEWMQHNPAEVVWRVDANCGETDADNPFVQLIQKCAKQIYPNSKLRGLACHSDMGFFIDAGIPTVNFGPGDSRMAHQDDERVAIETLCQTTKIIAKTIMEWCGAYEKC